MTTDNFHAFAAAVRAQFDKMAKKALFVVDSDRDGIWERYLSAWPAGTNPIFRTRTEHDCSCCRGFIRNVGNVVAIKDGELVTVWDVAVPWPYQVVADAMAAYIKALPIRDVFLTKQAALGTEKSIELIDGRTHQWRHFSATAPTNFVNRHSLDEVRGERRTTHQVLLRGVRELTPAAVAQVQELIKDNAIYRGTEFSKAVKAFAALQARFLGINDPARQELLAWELLDEAVGVARFRNTVIGTLVQDLSGGMALEEAVRIYESKVAPHNYKRPTALITKSMVEAATKTIAELGLEEALERRYARFEDVPIDAVLFVDNSVRGRLKGGLKDLLLEEVRPAPFDKNRAEEISITDFLSKLPAFTSVQLFLENNHAGNFMSLTAPRHADAKALFQWDNDFAWSYDGNVTDSIKEKVKRAGGRVENVALRVSLAWSNFDDLDLHCNDPQRGHIYYGNKAGILDVDMNVSPTTREPVENMRWVNLTRDGTHRIWVREFHKRETVDVGFEIEVEADGLIHNFSCDRAMRHGEEIHVLNIDVKGGRVVDIKSAQGIKAAMRAQQKWGLKTQELVRVNSLILSPNHWNGEVGNKHWFFILEGCNNPEPTRGIYNEFLSHKLTAHRKVFEVLGDKTKCPPAADQMSGLGFSSTQANKVTVLATGPRLNKIYTVVFGKD